MSSKKERAEVREFVRHRLRDKPDLSKLTLGLLKRQYLLHVGRESLSPEAKAVMKQVVEEELAKMQEDDDDESNSEVDEPQNKRKRDNQDEKSEEEIESRGKKGRFTPSTLSSDVTGSEDERQSRSSSKGIRQEVNKSSLKCNSEDKGELVSNNSLDEESDKSKSESSETGGCSSPEQKPDSRKIPANGKKEQIKNASAGKKTSESDAESSDASNGRVSSEKEDKALGNKRDNGSDSDSSSLPSLEREKDRRKNANDEKKKATKGVETSRNQKQDSNKAIIKLKRYISLCGVRRNYKKMLEGCKSVRAKVAVLKKELEDLGVQGHPSLEKCKKIRMKREEAQELAELDVGNIIATQGRPKRRGISARQEYNESPLPAYQRTLNSSSGSDQENNTSRERKKISEWANLRGIISDDGDSS